VLTAGTKDSVGDLISYQNDRKSCTATVGNVERA